MKNVLITGEAYTMLLEMGFQPHQLLAKLPKSKDRIKSPKSQKFIHIYSQSYKNLLKEYTEEELILRRDGYIKSPESDKLVKVFSKSFNLLLNNYKLEDLLKQPRLKKGDKTIGIDFNNIVTLKMQCELLKKSKITKDKINNLINTSNNIAVYIKATLKDKDYVGFFYGCGLFKNKKLVEYFELKKYSDEVFYTNKIKIFDDVTSYDEYIQFLQEDNEDQLLDITIDTIDITSLNNKAEVVLKINNFNKTDLLSLCQYHCWIVSNCKLLKLLKPDYTCHYSINFEENIEENSKEVILIKNKLLDEINKLKVLI